MNRLLLIGMITAIGTAALPARASAQSAAPALKLSDHPATPAPTRVDPQQYLGTAKQLLDAVPTKLLDAVPTKSLDADAQIKLSRLREDFTNLVTKYQTRSLTAPSSSVSVTKNVVDWKMKFADVERDLTLILGGRSSSGASSTTAVGTTGVVTSTVRPAGADSSADLEGVAGSEIGVKNLNPGVRRQLEQVRTSVELFYDATSRTP
jgi:hypothetical protein